MQRCLLDGRGRAWTRPGDPRRPEPTKTPAPAGTLRPVSQSLSPRTALAPGPARTGAGSRRVLGQVSPRPGGPLTWHSKPSRPWWFSPPSPGAARPRCPCRPGRRSVALPWQRKETRDEALTRLPPPLAGLLSQELTPASTERRARRADRSRLRTAPPEATSPAPQLRSRLLVFPTASVKGAEPRAHSDVSAKETAPQLGRVEKAENVQYLGDEAELRLRPGLREKACDVQSRSRTPPVAGGPKVTSAQLWPILQERALSGWASWEM